MSRPLRGWKCTVLASAAAIGIVLPVFIAACGLESGGSGAGYSADAPSPDGGGGDSASLPPKSEICNGQDENSNGIVDEGCPNCTDVSDGICKGALSFEQAAPGVMLGVPDPADSFFKVPCDPGAAVVGAVGTESIGYTESLLVRCAPIGIQREAGDAGFQYRVVWTGEPSDTGSLHGSGQFDAYRAHCEKPKVVVGMKAVGVDHSGGGSDGMGRIDLLCAELRVSGGPGAWAFSHGEISTVSFGPSSSTTPKESVPAPPFVWGGMSGQPVTNGNQRLRALGAVNLAPVLNLVPSAP
ncbi:hypothetical protein LZC95_10270 [Pendulispora brunnea]|uniref:Uncharacterized protein n=1 Tax=Pendulispora brunnea TaxID=2905690 RepID=A0ABZ2KGL6_9BACT